MSKNKSLIQDDAAALVNIFSALEVTRILVKYQTQTALCSRSTGSECLFWQISVFNSAVNKTIKLKAVLSFIEMHMYFFLNAAVRGQ